MAKIANKSKTKRTQPEFNTEQWRKKLDANCRKIPYSNHVKLQKIFQHWRNITESNHIYVPVVRSDTIVHCFTAKTHSFWKSTRTTFKCSASQVSLSQYQFW